MKNYENKNDKEKIVIEKYRKIQNLNSIVTVISIFLLPIIVVAFYISQFYQSVDLQFLGIPILVFVALVVVSSILTRICPNCKAYLGKYNAFPGYCKNCKMKLR
tara:strand:+ start:191 stop:502 length:312 start_codon:yes stop_codon:yes gene_type:complete